MDQASPRPSTTRVPSSSILLASMMVASEEVCEANTKGKSEWLQVSFVNRDEPTNHACDDGNRHTFARECALVDAKAAGGEAAQIG